MPPTENPRPLRLGLLGGTFDPPHLGHLAVAEAALTQLGLDRVDFLPANDPWQKSGTGRDVTSATIRLEMVRALVGRKPGLGVDDREIVRGGLTYTVETLEDILESTPGTEIFLIMGADTARGFHTWQRHEEVARLSTLVVVNRETAGVEQEATPAGAANVLHVRMAPVDFSSTQVRADIAAGRPVESLVGAEVASVIARHRLYVPAA